MSVIVAQLTAMAISHPTIRKFFDTVSCVVCYSIQSGCGTTPVFVYQINLHDSLSGTLIRVFGGLLGISQILHTNSLKKVAIGQIDMECFVLHWEIMFDNGIDDFNFL